MSFTEACKAGADGIETGELRACAPPSATSH